MKGVYIRGLEEPYLKLAAKAVACLPLVWESHAWVPVILSYQDVTVVVRHPFVWRARHYGFIGPKTEERIFQGGIAIHAYVPPVTYRENQPHFFSGVRAWRLSEEHGTERVVRAVARALANAIEQVRLDIPRERLWRRLERLEGCYPYLWSILDQIERSEARVCEVGDMSVEECAWWEAKLDNLQLM